jgi:hypothetical protein
MNEDLELFVGGKSPFPLNEPISTRTFCKLLILPNVGVPGPPAKSIAYVRLWPSL